MFGIGRIANRQPRGSMRSVSNRVETVGRRTYRRVPEAGANDGCEKCRDRVGGSLGRWREVETCDIENFEAIGPRQRGVAVEACQKVGHCKYDVSGVIGLGQ